MTADVRLDGDQLIATRHIDADPDLVWAAFTTPEHLAGFWGGDHATVLPESVSVDLRVGGTFTLETMAADGSSQLLRFRYEAVDPPTRLVLFEPSTGITTQVHIRPAEPGTVVTVRQRRLPPELQTDRASTGLAAVLRRLDDVVRTMTHTGGTRS